MQRRRFLAGAGTAAVAALSGCAAVGSTAGGDDYDVGMTAVAFRPPELTVSAGETVVWKNTSSRAHSVTAYESGIPEEAAYFASGGYESEEAAREAWTNLNGAITSGEVYEHTFEVPGTYQYFCIPHERGGMLGTVTVEE
jgi:plastocyanin